MNNSIINRDCPPLMSDGRHVTDYRPSCEVHSGIRYHNGLCDSNKYRQFMMNNAERMMELNRQHYMTLRGCESCKFIHPDPNNNDTFWAYYRKQLYGQESPKMKGAYQ